MDAFRGDKILLRDGREVVLVDVDSESGWPIVEIPGKEIFTVNPVEIQEGWRVD
jgi:rhodanese-related sulfurtransferase